jgi:hypothetical protein
VYRHRLQQPTALITDAPVQGIKMEVGIEDCLHIEFEFDKQKYHLKVILKLYWQFFLVFSCGY